MSRDAIFQVLGQEPENIVPLSGGCVGEVYLVSLADSERLVAKVDDSSAGTLDIEGYMLQMLSSYLPVPRVVHADANLLLMEWVPGVQGCDSVGEEHAAELLVALHGVTQEQCGLERDTLIGGLPQPNPRTDSWVEFFAEHRLVHMARLAHDHDRMEAATLSRVESLAGRLSTWLTEPDDFSLLHGDIWSGNVLSKDGRITAFLDPAIYYGDAEVELAFITMFQTFGDRFFQTYQQARPIQEGFWEQRRHLYNLYPYLVHTRLFGGSYLHSVKAILKQLGS